jgi:hypothetical protein
MQFLIRHRFEIWYQFTIRHISNMIKIHNVTYSQ